MLAVASFALLAAPAHAITYGDDAGAGEYPWTVALVFHATGVPYPDQFCGGTLIAPSLVLTAAHCVQGLRPLAVDVVAGENDLSDPSATRIRVNSIALHPYADVDEDTGAPPRRDLALLTLDDPVPGASGKLIEIGRPSDVTSSLRATGWGRDETGASPALMQVATLGLVSDSTCFGAWGSSFRAQDAMCALGSDGTRVVDTCNGDSGGPLVRPGSDPTVPADWRLVGATSYGSAGCDLASRPGVYARVTAAGMREFPESLLDLDASNDPAPQPYWSGGPRPAFSVAPEVGQTLTCPTSGPTWGPAATSVSLQPVIRELTGAGDLETLAFSSSYTVRADDVGARLFCEVRARSAGAGGYGVAQSALGAAVPAPAPAPTTSAGGSATSPTTAPAQTAQVPVAPATPAATADITAPSVTSVRRSCAKRTCSFVVATGDATPSAGVKGLGVALTSVVASTCRKRRCSKTSTRGVVAKAASAGRFTFSLKKLRKGVYTLIFTAVDGAGNVQRSPTRLRFRIR